MLNDTLKKISRLIYVLNALEQGIMNVAKLAEELSVTVRTIERDLKILEEAGYPIANINRGEYSFVEGFSLSKINLDNREGAMLALMGDIAKNLGNHFTETYTSLRNKVVESAKTNPFYIKMEKGQTLKNQQYVKILEKTIKSTKQVSLDYEGSSKMSGKPFSPLKIAWFNGFWYLLAYGKGNTILKLRLDKISNLKELDTKFERPNNIDAILNDSSSIWFEETRGVKVVLNVDSEVAHYFEKREYFPKQKIIRTNNDRSIDIECFVAHYEEIMPTILGWIPHIKVITPIDLNTLINKKIEVYMAK